MALKLIDAAFDDIVYDGDKVITFNCNLDKTKYKCVVFAQNKEFKNIVENLRVMQKDELFSADVYPMASVFKGKSQMQLSINYFENIQEKKTPTNTKTEPEPKAPEMKKEELP